MCRRTNRRPRRTKKTSVRHRQQRQPSLNYLIFLLFIHRVNVCVCVFSHARSHVARTYIYSTRRSGRRRRLVPPLSLLCGTVGDPESTVAGDAAGGLDCNCTLAYSVTAGSRMINLHFFPLLSLQASKRASERVSSSTRVSTAASRALFQPFFSRC